MSTLNPTRLQIGQVATIDGQRMTVRGRVVLSMVADDGETYYWNEFNLVGDAGREVTLVFEETEDGPTWKWFELFEPLRPLSAAEAKAVRVGQSVDLGEGRLHVTLVDKTRVEHVEGEAQEGVEEGDVAQYFNADSREQSYVVSWTGEEIDCYRGHELPRGRVEALFKLEPQLARQVAPVFTQDPQRRTGRGLLTKIFTGIAVVAVAGLFFNGPSKRSRSTPAQPPSSSKPAVAVAPPVVLVTGANGVLAGHELKVMAHAVERVVRMGLKFERHEYVTSDKTGVMRLLVNSAAGSPRDWYLLSGVTPPAGFSSFEAAALRQNKTVEVGGRALQVFQVFASEVRSTDGAVQELWGRDGRTYGLLARVDGELVLIRWDQTRLQWFQGRPVAEADVRAALAAPAVERNEPRRL